MTDLEVARNYQNLANDIHNVIINFLDNQEDYPDYQHLLTILHLRLVNRKFYNLIYSYLENNYSIKQIISTANNTYILFQNGDLYGCGAIHNFGLLINFRINTSAFSLGLNSRVYASEKFLKVNRNITQVYSMESAEDHSFVVSNGNLYARGYIFGKHHSGATLINNFHDISNLKKIIPTSNQLYFLYNNGDVFIMNSSNRKTLLNINIDNLFLMEANKLGTHNTLWLNKDGDLLFTGGYIRNHFSKKPDIIKNQLNFRANIYYLELVLLVIGAFMRIFIDLLLIKYIAFTLDMQFIDIIIPLSFCSYMINIKEIDFSYIKYLTYNLALLVCNNLLSEKIANSCMPIVTNFCSTLIANQVSNLSVYAATDQQSEYGSQEKRVSIFFSQKHRLFSYGYNCYNMQLGLRENRTNGCQGITRSLPKQSIILAKSQRLS